MFTNRFKMTKIVGMRVIAGKFRGIVIPSPKEEIVKPTLDRVKENLFNIIQFRLQDATILDLFCGSGALGIECLSRGAKEVHFVDNNKQNIASLKNFLDKIKTDGYFLHNLDYYDALKSFNENSFDIIFIDPPYDSGLAEIAIQKILRFNLLKENGIIIWEHPRSLQNNKFLQKVYNSRNYGTVTLDFIKK